MGAGTSTAAAAPPPCFGAAARDPLRPCTNPTLSVFPAVADRDRVSVSACRATTQEPAPVCAFGVPAARARATVALIGDSHAKHWRAALDVVAHAKRWRGLSVTTSGCMFSTAARYLPDAIRAQCVEWNRGVRAWFADHPEVHTVFISQAVHTPLAVRAGQTLLETKVAGFKRAWTALPKSVKHVVVLRDIPYTWAPRFDCIARVVAEGKEPPGPACRTERWWASKWDPTVSTVLKTRSKRIRYVDLTDFFCDPKYCFPVIGGVLVHRDTNHMTVAFSTTLGPYLLRALRRLAATW